MDCKVLSSKCQVVFSGMRITGNIRLKIDQHMRIRLDLGVDHEKSESSDSGLDRKRRFIPAPLFDVNGGSSSLTQSSDNSDLTEAVLSPDTGVFSLSETRVLNKTGGVLKPVSLRNPVTTSTEIKRKSLIGVYPLTETSVSSSSTINLIEDLNIDGETDLSGVKTGTKVANDVRSTIQQIQNTITAMSEIGNESSSEEEDLPQEYDHPLSETPMVSPLDPVKDLKFDYSLESDISKVETLVIDLKTSDFQQKSPPPIKFNSPLARESSKPSKSLITELQESQVVKITVQKSKLDGSINSLIIPLADSDPKTPESPSQITPVKLELATPKRESLKTNSKYPSNISSKTASSPESIKSNLNESTISGVTESFSSYSSGTRAAIFTIKAENLPKNGKKNHH